ncbi:hypothetical protein BDP27DRAFT_1367525 [Rhodocollybia butyracea]|uniref:Uncharacterized protein n=1 Tax=Rhodocollybia butyracea TaxID=206335 RepID=A0A9P5U309_9AGAR|nr:hypothetical protein BDP27DRAFT_1367525 [Rhodocollybia butyracea]
MLKMRNTWKKWDDRVLKIFVGSGLRPLPTLEYPNIKEGVTLKCTRKQETLILELVTMDIPPFIEVSVLMLYAYGRISTMAQYMITCGYSFDSKRCIDPHNMIYSAGATKEYILKNIIGLQNLASFGYIEGVGHTASDVSPPASFFTDLCELLQAPQESPQRVAETIFECLKVDARVLETKL